MFITATIWTTAAQDYPPDGPCICKHLRTLGTLYHSVLQ